MSVLIKNGRIITATDDYVGDVLIQGEKIAAIVNGELGSIGTSGDVQVIDASGQYVIPGGIDPHVHLALPFMGTVSADDFESGTRAAAIGGTTCLIDFAIPDEGESLLDCVQRWHEKAQGKAVADYSYHMAIRRWDERTAAEVPRVIKEVGITSFKCFMAYKGVFQVSDDELYNVLATTREHGGFVLLHCENGDMVAANTARLLAEGKTEPRYHAISRPSALEGEAAQRSITLARLAGQQIYIVHTTCKEALDAASAAQFAGEPVLVETCPQYLLIDDTAYDDPDFDVAARYVMSPPIRKKHDQEALWKGLADGRVQVVGTDTCSFTTEQKRMGQGDFSRIPNGAGELEERINLMHTYGVLQGRISLNQWVALCSTNAAKIFGLFPRKGTVTVGADADLVVYDPSYKGTVSAETHHYNADFSLFEGFKYQGRPSHVLLRGKVAVKDGKFVGEPGAGRFLRREPGSSSLR